GKDGPPAEKLQQIGGRRACGRGKAHEARCAGRVDNAVKSVKGGRMRLWRRGHRAEELTTPAENPNRTIRAAVRRGDHEAVGRGVIGHDVSALDDARDLLRSGV